MQYMTFWTDPSITPTMWLGLLFGVMCLATSFAQRAGESPFEQQSSKDMVSKYRNLTANAMVLADYTKPGAYTLETLLFYAESEYLRSDDSHVRVCVLSGLIVRLAK